MREPFLINPPKHRRKSNVGMKRHRILALESKGGGMFTSSRAKLVRPGIKINPFRRRRMRHNPFGELMFVGANPFKEVRHMARKRHRKNEPARRHKRIRHRRYRHNPAFAMKSLLPMVAAGVAGAIVARAVPKMLNMSAGMMTYGVQAAVVVGGGWAVGNFVNKEAGEGFIIGSAAQALTAMINDLLQSPLLAGLGLNLSDSPPTILVPYNQPVGAYEHIEGMGAFEQVR